MTRKFSYAILLAVLTGLGIIVAQSYWIVRTYKAREINFIRDASGALQFAVLQSMVGDQFETEDKKKESNSTGLTLPRRSLQNANTADSDAGKPGVNKTFRLSVDITDSPHQSFSNSFPLVIHTPANGERNVIGPVQVNINDSAFLQQLHQSLQQSKIDIPFHLFIHSSDTTTKEQYLISMPFRPKAGTTKLLVMDFPGLSAFLLRSMLAELLLSASIIIIALISFAYLLKTIFRQKQFAEMKNDFISNITHELKTPVSIMMATNEALLQFNAMDDKEKTKRYLVINQDELRKLQGMLENIGSSLMYEHHDMALQKQATDIDALLKKIIHRFSGIDGVTLHFSSNLQNNIILTNEDVIETIIANLVDNAIKYNTHPRRQVWVECESADKSISISVKDDGPGIEKKYLPFVFDKFFRVPQGNLHEVKGFGLGLNQVKQLVEKLGGKIIIQSAPGTGTVLTINLPLL